MKGPTHVKSLMKSQDVGSRQSDQMKIVKNSQKNEKSFKVSKIGKKYSSPFDPKKAIWLKITTSGHSGSRTRAAKIPK